MTYTRVALAALFAAVGTGTASADVVISTAATENMSCSSGTCVPTATNAVLNATDLENDLSQFGNVHVMTTGSGVEANNIEVNAAFSSPDSTSLTLDAHKAITINAAVSIGSGTAELELKSDTLSASDTLSFGRKGHITFGSLSDTFGINGGIFTLVGSVQGLAGAVFVNPGGSFALASSYDASRDGTYKGSPISTFSGSFEGLGNAISNLAVHSSRDRYAGSLFGSNQGIIKDFGLSDVVISGWGGAPLALLNYGTVTRCFATGRVKEKKDTDLGAAAGLVEDNYGTVDKSWANVEAYGLSGAGGLVWGNVSAGVISNSYAVGAPSGGWAGGLVGGNAGKISDSYSLGAVKGANYSGGLIGGDSSSLGSLNNNYWDTDTSGITNLSQGAGNIANDPGITGLSTEQLQSGLPTGFDPKIWAENPNINNGLPYLIANPPPK